MSGSPLAVLHSSKHMLLGQMNSWRQWSRSQTKSILWGYQALIHLLKAI